MSTFDISAFLNQSDEEAAAAAVALQNTLAKEGQGFQYDTTVFPISKIKPGAAAVIRFLPSGIADETEPYKFWIEKKVIELEFFDPTDDTKQIRFNVPVSEMYDRNPQHKCVTLQPVRELYKEAESLKKAGKENDAKHLISLANKHWITYTFIAQGFVNKAGFDEENAPENPIRIFDLKKTLFKMVLAGVKPSKDGDTSMLLKYIATHPMRGTDFVIRKTVKKTEDGDQNSYEQSGWARETSPLTETQVAALNKHGLHDLRARLPKRPSDDEYKVMREMVVASMEGKKTWNRDWDAALTTVKPFKVDRNKRAFGAGASSGGASSGGDDFAGEVAGMMGGGAPASSVSMATLKRGQASAPAETPAEDKSASVEAEVPSAPASGASNTDLLARIRSQINKK